MQVIGDWATGKPIHTIALGHATRWNPQTQSYDPQVFRQKKAQDYCFNLIIAGVEHLPLNFPMFQVMGDTMAPNDLSTEERQAAESLAWKALTRGWRIATSGFADLQHLELTREADA